MAQTIEQKIAEAEAELNRLHKQAKSLADGQKIVFGGMLLAAARHDPKIARWVLQEAEKSVTRPVDIRRVAPILEELRQLAAEKAPA